MQILTYPFVGSLVGEGWEGSSCQSRGAEGGGFIQVGKLQFLFEKLTVFDFHRQLQRLYKKSF